MFCFVLNFEKKKKKQEREREKVALATEKKLHAEKDRR